MRKSLLFLAGCVAVAVTSSGCTRDGMRGVNAASSAADAIGTTADLVTTLADLDTNNPQHEWTTDDGSPPSDTPASTWELRPIPPHLPASAADTRVDKDRPFDLGAAYGALAHVDLDACKDHGLSAGYGRVTLGFANDGTPAGVGVDLPDGSKPEARACVEQAFQAVRVAPFEGAGASVRRAFFVNS